MLKDYKYLISPRKPHKTDKRSILRNSLILAAVAFLGWYLFYPTGSKETLQFSFFKLGEKKPDAISRTTNKTPTKEKQGPKLATQTPLTPPTKEAPDAHNNILIATNIAKPKPDLALTDDQDPPTNLAKNQSNAPTNNPELISVSVIIEPGHTLNQMGIELKLSARDLGMLLTAAKKYRKQLILKPGRQIKFELHSQTRQLRTIRYAFSSTQHFVLSKMNKRLVGNTLPISLDSKLVRVTATITSNLFDAGRKAKIPNSVLLQLASVFNWDIDFARDLKTGNKFSILYKQFRTKDNRTESGELVAAIFTVAEIQYFAIQYTTPRGHTAWYTQDARPLKKRFLRSPLRLSRHQIQASNSIHNKHGIHYFAPLGTPVKSTASGTIVYMGNKRHYGKTVIVRHREGYSTMYAHLSRFRKHLKSGRKVSQGQVIAYVGKLGKSKPKLLYALRLRGKHIQLKNIPASQGKKLARRWRKDFASKTALLLQKLTQ